MTTGMAMMMWGGPVANIDDPSVLSRAEQVYADVFREEEATFECAEARRAASVVARTSETGTVAHAQVRARECGCCTPKDGGSDEGEPGAEPLNTPSSPPSTNWAQMPEVLTVPEAAALLRITPATLYQSIKMRVVPAFHPTPRSVRLLKSALREWASQQALGQRKGR